MRTIAYCISIVIGKKAEHKFLIEEFLMKKYVYTDRKIVTRSHYPETASALDFKDVTAPRFGHSDVVFCLFLRTKPKGTACQSSSEMLKKFAELLT